MKGDVDLYRVSETQTKENEDENNDETEADNESRT